MKAKRWLGTVAGVMLAGGMVASAGPRGPQDLDREGNQPPAGPGGAMMDRPCPMGPPPMGMCGGSDRASGARHQGPPGALPMGFDVERARKAGATEAQVKALADFEFEQAIKRVDLQAAAEKAGLKLDYLMKAKTADEKAILQAGDAVSQARGELLKLGLVSQLKEKEILGADLARKLHEPAPRGLPGPGLSGPHGAGTPADMQEGELRPPCGP